MNQAEECVTLPARQGQPIGESAADLDHVLGGKFLGGKHSASRFFLPHEGPRFHGAAFCGKAREVMTANLTSRCAAA
jgi:hypothetical protein